MTSQYDGHPDFWSACNSNSHCRRQHIDERSVWNIYQTMLNEINCIFDVSFSRFYCCGCHGIGPRRALFTARGDCTVPALESWRPPGGLSEAPPPGPRHQIQL